MDSIISKWLGGLGVKGLSMLTGFLSYPVLSSHYDGYVAAQVFLFIGLFSLLINLDITGLGMAIRKEVSVRRSFNLQNYLLSNLTVVLVRAFIFTIISVMVGILAFHERFYVIVLFAFGVISTSFLNLQGYVALAKENVHIHSLVTLGPIILFNIIVLILHESVGLISLVSIFISINIVFWLIYFWAKKPRISQKLTGAKKTFDWNNSMSYSFSQALFLLVVGFNDLIYQNFFDSEAVVIHQGWSKIYNLFIVFVGSVTNPLWSRLENLKNNQARVNRNYSVTTALKILAIFSVFLFLFFKLSAKIIALIFYSKLYFEITPRIYYANIIYIVGFAFYSVASAYTNTSGSFNLLIKILSLGAILKYLSIYLFLDYLLWSDLLLIQGIILLISSLILMFNKYDRI